MKRVALILLCLVFSLLKIFAQINTTGLGKNGRSFFGAQVGYAVGLRSQNVFELGGNLYKNKDEFNYRIHASLGFTQENKRCHIVQRAGVNLQYLLFRLHPAVEHHGKGQFLVGSDIGASFLGVFPYYGYYLPLSNDSEFRSPQHRIGVRFVWNMANVHPHW